MQNSENKKKSVFSLDYLFYDFAKITSIPSYLWFRPKRIFASKAAKKHIKGGALVVSNHVGFMDPVIIMFGIWYRRHHFVCLKIFMEGKRAFFFKRFHCIPIDRENFGMESFRVITDHLKNDEIVSMFPEGHINEQSGINQFKSGMILMSIMSGKPIVPVCVKNRKHWYERYKIAIGEPVDITALYGSRPNMKQIEEATAKLYEIEQKLAKLLDKK